MEKIMSALLAVLTDEQRAAFAAAFAPVPAAPVTSGQASTVGATVSDPVPAPVASAPDLVLPSTKADPGEVARGIVKEIMKDGKIWAARGWHSPRLCSWAGHLLSDGKGYYFALCCSKENSTAILCKKVRDNGTVYGQTVVRLADHVKDHGAFTGVKADFTSVSARENLPAPAPVASAPVASAPVSQASSAAPVSQASPVASYPIPVPSGASALVIVEPSGQLVRRGDGQVHRLSISGAAARSILAGNHPRWSRRIERGGFSLRFEGCEGC